MKPLGSLANAKLRGLRVKTHREFDRLWKECQMSRTAAYEWLSRKIGGPAHIGSFDEQKCLATISWVAHELEGKKRKPYEAPRLTREGRIEDL